MMRLIPRADVPLGRLRRERFHDQKLTAAANTNEAPQTVRNRAAPSSLNR